MIPRPRTRPFLVNNPQTTPSSVPQPTEPQVAWKTVFISAAVGGAAVYLVSKILTTAEKKLFPDTPPQSQIPSQVQPQLPQMQQVPPPPPGYVYTSAPTPMPSMMQPAYGYQTAPMAPVAAPAPQPQIGGGLTESDLHAWAHELETRETDLEQRETKLKAEQRRLRLVS